MRPVVDRLAETYGEQLHVLALDADSDGRSAFRAAGLRGHPSYVLLDADGREVWRGIGIVDYQVFEDAVETTMDN